MDVQVLTTVATGALLAMFAAILAWQGKGRFDAVKRRLDRLEAEVFELRRDFNHLVLALGTTPRPQTG